MTKRNKSLVGTTTTSSSRPITSTSVTSGKKRGRAASSASSSSRRRSSVMEVDENRRQTLIRDFFHIKQDKKKSSTTSLSPSSSSRTPTNPTPTTPTGTLQARDLNSVTKQLVVVGQNVAAAAVTLNKAAEDEFLNSKLRSLSPPHRITVGPERYDKDKADKGHAVLFASQTPRSESSSITTSTETKGQPSHKPKASTKRYQQLYLDLGQRDFAKQQFCSTCGMMYVHGVQEDANEHERICKDYQLGVSFHSESARVVAAPGRDSMVYQIRAGDNQALWKKVKQVRVIVDQEMGFVPDPVDTGSLSTFLYTYKKRIVGLCSVLPIRRGYVLEASNSERSRQGRKAMIGIHQIWVHAKFRKQGIATLLLDTIREKLIFGMMVPASQVAFSSPTDAGASFARRYVHMTSGSSQVLVYDVKQSAV